MRLPNGTGPLEFERLASLETDECVIWPYTKGGQRGYGQMYLAGTRKKEYTHRLALIRRGITPQPGQVARHGPCNSPACMNYRHLTWGTVVENAADKLRDGAATVGEKNPMAKLSPGVVERMRVKRQQTGDHYRVIADRWGVSTMTAFRAITKRAWAAS